jgi:RNA polymerase sigma factor (sigma-70 family)
MTAVPDWNTAGRSPITDAELARAATTGDRGAFAGIYDRYADRLHDFCIGMLRNRDDAADCVQDTFCTAATQLSGLREPDKLRPWLYAIARNEALRRIRDRRREELSDEMPDMMSTDAGPDILAARSELADLIAEAAGGLSDRDRAVLELSYRHGLQGPELAQALGVSHTNANTMVLRLRETIERSLGALLVARGAGAASCPGLCAVLAGWDGTFTVLMRKRIARHIESCPTCDQDRRRRVNPAALLGGTAVFVPAPAWLRQRTLHEVELTCASTPLIDTPFGAGDTAADGGITHGMAQPADYAGALGDRAAAPPEHPVELNDDGVHLSRRLLLLMALLIGVPLTALGLTLAWIHHHDVSVIPADSSRTAPTPINPGSASTTSAQPTPATTPPAPGAGTTDAVVAPPSLTATTMTPVSVLPPSHHPVSGRTVESTSPSPVLTVDPTRVPTTVATFDPTQIRTPASTFVPTAAPRPSNPIQTPQLRVIPTAEPPQDSSAPTFVLPTAVPHRTIPGPITTLPLR